MGTPGGASKRGSHRLAETALCPRKWYLHNARGLVPLRTPDYYMEGTLIHLALAYYWGEKIAARTGVVPAWLKESSLDAALAKKGAGYPEAIRLAKDVVAAYRDFYAAHDVWVPVAVEEEWTATLGDLRRQVNPYSEPQSDDGEVVSCRIDLMVESNGKLWAVDFKTTAHGYRGRLPTFNPDGEYAVHWQFALQTAILRHNFGARFGSVIVERILKKDPFDFDRAPAPMHRRVFLDVPNVVAALAANERRIAKDVATAFALNENMETWMPMGHYWNCFSWGKPCEYRPICTAEHSEAIVETINREFTVE